MEIDTTCMMNRRIMVPKPSLFTGVTVSGWEQVITMLTMCNYSRCLKGANVLHRMFKFLCESFQTISSSTPGLIVALITFLDVLLF